MRVLTYLRQKYLIINNNAFYWDSENRIVHKIDKINSIPLDLLLGIDSQKDKLLKNTKNFAVGNFTNNALLWGSRGNGKSTLVKSIFNKLYNENKNLKIIQINKEDILEINKIFSIINEYFKFRFILFIDDLSFEKLDNNYKLTKSLLDGNIQNQPKNSILYVTSNRRHLMSRDMIDNERSSAIHTDESVEEKISLSDRFGLWIGFHNLSQDKYLDIVRSYCKYYKIELNKNDLEKSIQWSLQRGNRNGRTAWQFIINLAAEQNLKIFF